MRRSHNDALLGTRFQPAIKNASARKYECVRAVIVYDRQFEIAVEWRGRYRLPLLHEEAAKRLLFDLSLIQINHENGPALHGGTRSGRYPTERGIFGPWAKGAEKIVERNKRKVGLPIAPGRQRPLSGEDRTGSRRS